MALDIQPLTPDRLPDLADALRAGRRPEVVLVHVVSGPRMRDLTNATARRAIGRSWRRPSDEGDRIGQAPGLVAYDDGRRRRLGQRRAAGGLRAADPLEVLAPVDDTPVWSIVCFVVGQAGRAARASPADCWTARSTTPGPRRAGPGGLPGRGARGRAHRQRQCLQGHARDVRARRLRGRRATPRAGRQDPPTDRPPRPRARLSGRGPGPALAARASAIALALATQYCEEFPSPAGLLARSCSDGTRV